MSLVLSVYEIKSSIAIYDARYDAQMEDLLDQAYEQYVSKKEGSAKQRKRIKQANSEDAQLLEV